MNASPPSVAIIGSGPAGLMAAERAASGGAAVAVYDHMPTVGRKFLLAGRGGLNLTHSEDLATFMTRYGAAAPKLAAAIEALPPSAVRAWCEELGQPTFVGSSGRVFPVAMKASPLLRAWLRRLAAMGVEFRMRHRWEGWEADGALRFSTPVGAITVRPGATVLALGGASWPRLGSDGAWTEPVVGAGIAVRRLRPANCGFLVPWSELFRERYHGTPLKGVGLTFGERTLRGEALITREGVEGGGIYALSAALRDAIEADGEAVLHIDLRPGMTEAMLAEKLARVRGRQSLSTFLRKAVGLGAAEIALLQEVARAGGSRLADSGAEAIAALIKAVPLRLVAPAPIARAISTAGGVAFDGVDDAFMLRARPGTFIAGEMLDWEAPTGGYLLQACFATGAVAGRNAAKWAQSVLAM